MKFGSVFWGLFAVVLSACVSAEQNPEPKKWEVKATRSSEGKLWVSKSDGSKQCEKGAKYSPESAAQELKKAGVMVFQFRNGSDGRIHPTVCGAASGNTVDLEIAEVDSPRAQKLGYRVLKASAQN